MALDGGGSTDWATVTTQNAESNPGGAWAAALSGVALGVYIDRTLNAPQHIGGSDGYGVNPDGSVYQLGQLAPGAQVPVRGGGNNMLLLLLVLGFVLTHGKA